MDTINPLTPYIDEYLFERQFERFRKHVLDQSGRELVSFTSNSYTEKEEGWLISFADSGEILISPKLTAHDGELLGINSSLRLTCVDGRHHQYLNYHRTYKFKKE